MKTILDLKQFIPFFKEGRSIRKCLQGSDGIYAVFDDYEVDSGVKANGITKAIGLKETGSGNAKASLGHGMAIAVHEDTGKTRGSDYGRYDKDSKGIARRVKVPNFKMATPGKPTQQELDDYARSLDKMYGHSGGRTTVHYVRGANADEMEEMMKSAETNNREKGYYVNSDYRILDHNCGTYAADMIKKSMPWYKFSGFGLYTWGTPSGAAPYWGGTGKYKNE